MPNDETMGEKPLRITLRRVGQKTMRLDRPVEPGADPDAKAKAVDKGGSLIEMILKAIRSDPTDRRRDPRHPALEQEVWVGWWTGDDYGAVSGRLLNISLGGAQIILDCRPPKKTSVWIYKDDGSTLATVRGEVVAVSPAPGGDFSVRFRFAVPCPTVFSESVVCRRTRRGGGIKSDQT